MRNNRVVKKRAGATAVRSFTFAPLGHTDILSGRRSSRDRYEEFFSITPRVDNRFSLSDGKRLSVCARVRVYAYKPHATTKKQRESRRHEESATEREREDEERERLRFATRLRLDYWNYKTGVARSAITWL